MSTIHFFISLEENTTLDLAITLGQSCTHIFHVCQTTQAPVLKKRTAAEHELPINMKQSSLSLSTKLLSCLPYTEPPCSVFINPYPWYAAKSVLCFVCGPISLQ